MWRTELALLVRALERGEGLRERKRAVAPGARVAGPRSREARPEVEHKVCPVRFSQSAQRSRGCLEVRHRRHDTAVRREHLMRWDEGFRLDLPAVASPGGLWRSALSA